MIAGIGCRSGVTSDEVLAALDAALAPFARERKGIVALAVLPVRAGETAIADAARRLGVPLMVAPQGTVATPTRSPRSMTATGHGSACEAAALLACGEGARLLGPRTVAGAVTCALAEREAFP